MRTRSWTPFYLVVTFALFLTSCRNVIGTGFSFTSEQSVTALRVGAANVTTLSDIGELMYVMDGYGRIQATGMHDPITVRSLVLDNVDRKLAFITIDVAFGFTFSEADERLSEITQKTGILPEDIFISASHTHAGPWMDTNFGPDAYDAIRDAIIKADSALEEANVFFSAGLTQIQTNNRRNPERDVDGTITTMQIINLDGKVLATLVNFACHPVFLGPDNTLLSADFVYYLRNRLEQEYGGVALFFNRHAGDINPPGGWNRKGGTFSQAEAFGIALAEDVIAIQSNAKLYSINIQSNCRRIDFHNVDIAVINLGAAQIITIPGESLSGFGKNIDDIIPGPYKFFFSYTNGHIGYIVPENE